MRRRIAILGLIVAVFALFFILLSGSGESAPDPILVFTKIPATGNHLPGGSENLPPKYKEAEIVSLNYENPDEGIRNLTPEFYSATSPSLSFDNQRIVFSAQEEQNGSWQIWTMSLDGSDKTKIFESTESCFTPSFLPTNEIVFSCEISNPMIGMIYPLFKVQADGSGLEQITFHPHRDFNSSMLYDGRIAMISQQVYPSKKKPLFMVLRPDGTKAQVFYHDNSDFQIKSAVRESHDENLIFVQSDGNVDELVALSYANPLLPKKVIASFGAGHVQSADILDSSRVVISVQNGQNGQNGVFSLSAVGANGDEELIYQDENYHSIQPVAVRNRRIPKKLPSSIADEEGSGILISQDVNHSQIGIEGDPETAYIRIEGIEKTFQEIEVAKDGSFYLRVQSDMPIRFVSLDAKKERLRGPSEWIWLRTNERRACVGCHARKEMSPVNLVPMAIKKDPVIITDTSRVASMSEVQAVREIVNEN
ncbi:MAG: hypothetical protein R3220_12505 [Balneolaceae bacterium]|nr:hypothetical protein [Balneolaceae bacterium]